MRPHFETVIESLNLLGRLAEFSPVVIGTPPLGIATNDSDIDIACTARELEGFRKFSERTFGHLENFAVKYLEIHNEPAALASFVFSGWNIEVFCQNVETEVQWGVRHFRVEQRLIALEPNLRLEIQRLKELGIKTEPAFAKVLKLSGNPYKAILDLEHKSDDTLRDLLERHIST